MAENIIKIRKTGKNIQIKMNNIRFDLIKVESGENGTKNYRNLVETNNNSYENCTIDEALKEITKTIKYFHKKELEETVMDTVGEIETLCRSFRNSRTPDELNRNRKALRTAIQDYNIVEKELKVAKEQFNNLFEEEPKLDKELEKILEREISKFNK